MSSLKIWKNKENRASKCFLEVVQLGHVVFNYLFKPVVSD